MAFKQSKPFYPKSSYQSPERMIGWNEPQKNTTGSYGNFINEQYVDAKILLFEQSNCDFKHLVGEIVHFSQFHRGSLFLQKQINKRNPTLIQLVFSEVKISFYFLKQILEQLESIITDNYGNYLCKKLIQFSNAEQRITMLKKVALNCIN